VTELPIVYVWNTHQHDDHAGGDLVKFRADLQAMRNRIAALLRDDACSISRWMR